MGKFNKFLMATILAAMGHSVMAGSAVAVTSDTKQGTTYWVINPAKCNLDFIKESIQSSKTEHAKKTYTGICSESTPGIPNIQFTKEKGEQFKVVKGFIVVGHNINGWAACEAQPGLKFYTANKADRKILKGGELACGK